MSNVETPFTGVVDDRLASSEGSRSAPSVEQMFSHALPGQFTGPQAKLDNHAGPVELGHLLSFVAVECVVNQRGAPQVQGSGDDATIFFDFSADWLESIYQTEGRAVVGYFRYLNLLHSPSSTAELATATATTRVTTAPIVSVIDHYLFKGFCYEARALMLLEAVSFYAPYCKRFVTLYGDRLCGALPKGNGRPRPLAWSPAFPVLMRCRSMNLPILRLFQKLYRVLVRKPLRDHESETDCASSIHLMECAEGEVLHVQLSPELVHDVSFGLSSKVSGRARVKAQGSGCTVKLDKSLMVSTPTPFDALIKRHRPRWLLENAPFRKHTGKSTSSSSDSEDGPTDDHRTCHFNLPLAVPFQLHATTGADARGQRQLTPSSCYDTHDRPFPPPISVGPKSILPGDRFESNPTPTTLSPAIFSSRSRNASFLALPAGVQEFFPSAAFVGIEDKRRVSLETFAAPIWPFFKLGPQYSLTMAMGCGSAAIGWSIPDHLTCIGSTPPLARTPCCCTTGRSGCDICLENAV